MEHYRHVYTGGSWLALFRFSQQYAANRLALKSGKTGTNQRSKDRHLAAIGCSNRSVKPETRKGDAVCLSGYFGPVVTDSFWLRHGILYASKAAKSWVSQG